MKLIQIGAFALLLAAAAGVAQFFGIINADAYLHPTTAYKRAKLVVMPPPSKATEVKIYPEKGCKDQAPLKVVWSIRHEPDRWTTDGYHINTAGMEIWIANGPDYIDMNDAFPYSRACATLIWDTVQVWQKRRIDREAEEFTQ